MVTLIWGRWFWQRIKQRALGLATASAADWEALWRRGAFELKQGGRRDGATCVAPTGDWRGFVARHLGTGSEQPATGEPT